MISNPGCNTECPLFESRRPHVAFATDKIRHERDNLRIGDDHMITRHHAVDVAFVFLGFCTNVCDKTQYMYLLYGTSSSHKLQQRHLPSHLPMDRDMLYASVLLLFHFYYGNFVRGWLVGGWEYIPPTTIHRDWDKTFTAIQQQRERLPSTGYPPSDFPRGKRIFTQGVPSQGRFVFLKSHLPPLWHGLPEAWSR